MPFWAQDLLYVWFERLRPADWFGGSEAVDALLEARFGRWLEPLSILPPERFLTSPDLARAAILLFDQLPRNLYRDEARAYAFDELAVALTHGFLTHGWLTGLSESERQFVLMPLMHSEAIADQRLSVALFARHAASALAFARSHHRAIARFGRFPHRNEILGRRSTEAEKRAIAGGLSW